MPAQRLLVSHFDASAVTCACVELRGGRLAIRETAAERLSEWSGAPDWGAELARAFARLARHPWLRGELHVGLPGHLALARVLAVPPLDRGQRERVIRFEAQQALPYPLAEVGWDCRAFESRAGGLDVWLAAARRETLDAVGRAAAAANLSLAGIYPVPLALVRVAQAAPAAADGPVALVHLTARHLDLVLLDGTRSAVRSVALSGRDAAVSEAGTARSTNGGGAPDLSDLGLGELIRPPTPDGAVLEIGGAGSARMSEVRRELSRTLAHHRRNGGEPPVAIQVAADADDEAEMVPFLARALQMRVQTLGLPGLALPPHLARGSTPAGATRLVWAGLALSACTRHPRPLNLVPRELVRCAAARRRRPWLQAAVALLILALLLPGVRGRQELRERQTHLRAIEAALERAADLNARIASDGARTIAAQREIARMETLMAARDEWVRRLDELHALSARIDDAWIESLRTVPASWSAEPSADRADPAEAVASTAGDAGDAVEGGAVNHEPRSRATAGERLIMVACLLDRAASLPGAGSAAVARAREWLDALDRASFVQAVEHERFDATVPGVLRVEVVLRLAAVLTEEHPS